MVIAADNRPLHLLTTEFPDLEAIRFGGYNVKYSTYLPMSLNMIFQIPKILLGIKKEHTTLEQIIEDYKIDGVISDNRFGLSTKKVPCVFITHQLQIQSPFFTNAIQNFNYQYINKYNACWVMDDEKVNLAGNLSGFELLWNETYKTMVSEKTNYNKYLPDTHKYYVFIESTGSDYENDYSKLEDIISDSLEKGYIEDAVIGKNDKEQKNIWGIREDVSVLADERKHDQHFDISIPTSSIGVVIDKITTELKKNEDVKTIFPFGHVADGNIHFIIGKDSGEDSITKEVNKIIYSNIESVNGSISAEHGIGLDKKEYLKCTRNKEEIELMKLLKKSIDPKNILNPGRIL